MTDNAEDMALAALLETVAELAPELSTETLKEAYAVERAYRFDENRDAPLRILQKLIESAVATGAVK